MSSVFHFCLLMPGLVFSLCALNVVTDSMLTKAVSASDTGEHSTLGRPQPSSLGSSPSSFGRAMALIWGRVCTPLVGVEWGGWSGVWVGELCENLATTQSSWAQPALVCWPVQDQAWGMGGGLPGGGVWLGSQSWAGFH